MTTEEKYGKLLEICKKVVTNFDKAWNDEKYDELRWDSFIQSDDVEPIKEFLEKEESDNAQS